MPKVIRKILGSDPIKKAKKKIKEADLWNSPKLNALGVRPKATRGQTS